MEVIEEPDQSVIPPGWIPGSSGTIVVLDDIPHSIHSIINYGSKMKVVRENLARTYRYPIQEKGISLYVTSSEDPIPNDVPLKPHDPLCRMPRSESTERFGPNEDVVEGKIVFDGTGSRPMVFDHVNGGYAEITYCLVRIDPRNVRNALDIPLDAFVGGKTKSTRNCGTQVLANRSKAYHWFEEIERYHSRVHWVYLPVYLITITPEENPFLSS